MTHIGIKIKERREQLGMSQDELAAKMGYKSRSTIAKIEKGVNDVYQGNIVKFAEVLQTSIAYLMSWEEEEIDAVSQIQQEANAYDDEKERNELNKIIQQIIDLRLSEEELNNLFNYALFLKSQRKDDE